MFTFKYKDGSEFTFTSALNAVKEFNKMGYGMWNWDIEYFGVTITLKEFNKHEDEELAVKRAAHKASII